MFDAIQVSATGMRAHELQLNTISHNIANLNTVGFRRQDVVFADLNAGNATASPSVTTAAATPNTQPGSGTLAQVMLSDRAGALQQTNNSLDVAIEGAGFIEVLRSDGSHAYTRAGSLQLNEQGELMTATGELLAAQISVPQDVRDVMITPDGHVRATLSVDGEVIELGQIELVAFTNSTALQPLGNNLYLPTEHSGAMQVGNAGESGLGVLRQGYVESSNVQMIDELVALMVAQRAFEMNSRVVQTADQMQAIINGLIR